jgi:hypothetical protein
MKQLKASAALALCVISGVATGGAHAGSVTWASGTSDGLVVTAEANLSLSASAVFELNAGGMTFASIDPATSDITGSVGSYAAVTWQPASTSLTVDDDTHQVLDLATVGGFAIHATSVPDVAVGGDIRVSNLDFRFGTNEVYGTVSGLTADGTEIGVASVKLFDIVAGSPITLGMTAQQWLTFDGSFGTLQMTTEGDQLFTQALGLSGVAGPAIPSLFANFAVGQLHARITGALGGPITSLPEPASYAMTSLGLLMVGVAARGRRQTARPTQG